MFSDELERYTERVSKALKNSDFSELEKVVKILLEAREKNRWIFLAGNGGSASTASHFTNDMVKGLSIENKKRFKAKALCDPTPVMTAIANDYSYDVVFLEQLKNYSSIGDLLILFSGSGNSPNVVSAARYAKSKDIKVISFTGRDGGSLKEYSDICCIASTNCMEEIEDVHLIWIHAMATLLKHSIEGEV